MQGEQLRPAVLDGRRLLGAFISLSDPATVEVAAMAGLDYVVVDTEHFPFSPDKVAPMILAGDRAGIAVMVRVRGTAPADTLPYLELGAWGLVFPHIDSREAAEAAAAAVRYPPLGRRGFHGGTRAAGYGTDGWRGALRRGNERTLVVCQIEEPAGADAASEIASVEQIDVVMIGPHDLAVSCGRPGEVTSDVHRALMATIAATVHERGKAVAGFVLDPEEMDWCMAHGFNMVSARSDLIVLIDAMCESARVMRSHMEGNGVT